MESEPIIVAALGRPLYPGMLYDCRKHSYIPGVTLWDKKSVKDNMDIRSKLDTEIKFSSSDSLSDKCSLLDVNASLKASFFGGLVEVGGSAKYLRDTKSSKQQSRVTMHYSETTTFEQLTMTQLSQFTYPKVFKQKTATHVVTAVLYGAQAFMVFDRTFSDDDNKQKIEGELNVMVKKIPSFSIEGQGKVKMTDEEKNIAESISCTFHGDFHLEQNPTTYMEALQVYKQLPTLLKKNNESGVPIKVWLYPLSLLDEQAARLVREISTSLVASTEDIMEELGEAERRCNDLIRKAQINIFSDIKERLCTFQSSFSIYKLVLQKALGRVLPEIQGAKMEEQLLEEIMKTHNESPFNASSLNQWLDNTKCALDLLSSCTKCLKGIKTEDADGLKTILLNPDIDVVVCLNFTSLKDDDPYLTNLNDFLKSKQFEHDGNITLQSVASITKWFDDPNAITKMRENLSQFKSFSEANKDDKRMCFIISAIFDSSNPGSSIYLYEKGKLTDKQFQPLVTKLPAPKVIIQGNTVSINMSMFTAGSLKQYRVEYKEEKRQKKEWVVKNTTNENIILTGLEYGKEYLVRYRIVSKVGVSEASDTACLSLAPPVIVGGSGGKTFSFIKNSENTVKKITFYATDKAFCKIEVTFNNDETVTTGKRKMTGNQKKEIVFETDDKILTATLWPNNKNNPTDQRVAGLEFLVEKSDGQTETYSAMCKKLGRPVNLYVKSGRFYGITGRSGAQINALGLYFI
ncbi:cytolytic toxin-alpha-like [Misgurnus anguillicaudatus]|uniref:cytolytic toxin-alpha-like n=1 Tax=Misgurnus anguillicaudatus TaxID=75329 RepID=UPI003CCF9D60